MDLAIRFGRLAFSLGAYFSWQPPAPSTPEAAPYSAEAPRVPTGFQAAAPLPPQGGAR